MEGWKGLEGIGRGWIGIERGLRVDREGGGGVIRRGWRWTGRRVEGD